MIGQNDPKSGESQSAAPRLMTLQEVATFLGIPGPTLYAWRRRGEGPTSMKVGRHLRYRREDVDRWLEERAIQVSGDSHTAEKEVNPQEAA